MSAKTKKRLITIILVIDIILFIIVTTLCILYFPRQLTNELPNEKIVSVVKITENLHGESTKEELSKDKITPFNNVIKAIRYKRKYNFLGIKTSYFENVIYVITYENYTVKLSEHYLTILHGDEVENKISFAKIMPDDILSELDKLF